MAARAWGRRRETQRLMMAIRSVSRHPREAVLLMYDGMSYAVIGMELYDELISSVLEESRPPAEVGDVAAIEGHPT